MLRSIHLEPELVISPDIDETAHAQELPKNYAMRMASEKMMAVKDQYSDDMIITADTVVAKGRRILPKAETEADFDKCIKLISGGRHTTMTAVSVYSAKKQTYKTKLVTSALRVKRLHPSEISAFKATNEWQGKAGGYALQGYFGQFILFISGSYSAVVGLPVYETARMLEWARL